jgi:hypothetical protein
LLKSLPEQVYYPAELGRRQIFIVKFTRFGGDVDVGGENKVIEAKLKNQRTRTDFMIVTPDSGANIAVFGEFCRLFR